MPPPIPIRSNLGLLAGLAIAAGPQAELREFSSSPVELETLPESQQRAVQASRPVRESLTLDGHPFSTVLDGEQLRVATTTGDAPSRRLQRTQVLALAWEADGQRRERSLRFEPDGGGGWRYGSPTAHRFEVEGDELVLVDADLDGQLTILHDAWSLGLGAPLQPLASHLILGDRELAIESLEPDGSRLEGRLRPLAEEPARLAALRRLNHLRLADGLGAVHLDPELSAGCTAHAEYLRLREWEGGGEPHEQDSGAPGASREGRAAARRSEILALPPAGAVEALWSTLHGRALLGHPDLVTIGLSMTEAELTVLDASSRPTKKSLGRRAWVTPLLSPANGAHSWPTRYGATSAELPLPGADRMGPPLLLWIHDGGAEVEGYAAELSRGSRRLETRVVRWEQGGRRAFGVLPRRPLQPGTPYRLVHRLRLDGEELELEARFATD